MRNLLYGCILVILGIFLAMGYDWAKENFVPSPLPPYRPTQGNTHYPEIDYLRKNALRKLADIPPFEQQQLRDSLASTITTLDSWLAKISTVQPDVICVGENHDDVTRAFLATRFFPKYPVDVLMLEITHDNLAILVKLIESGSSPLSMLEADVAEVIRAARAANMRVSVQGIEETRSQRIARFKTRAGSREQSIVDNFNAHFRNGRRHAVLYGALHCIDEPNWFLGRIRKNHGHQIGSTLSVNVVNAHGSGETEAFLNFLNELGLPPPPFVVPHTAMLHAEIYAWFPHLTQSLRQYDAAIVF
jgi:hypothetical protein